MQIVFPKLDSLVSKDAKLNDDSIQKYIHVIGNYAVVINHSIVVVDLREYIKVECEITDEFEKLDEILSFFQGRSFTPDIWKEFTTPSSVHLNGNYITLDSMNFSKTLDYNEPPVLLTNVIKLLIDNIDKPAVNVSTFAVNFNELNKVATCFKKELKGLHLVMKNCGQDIPVVFQAQSKDYIFGLIPASYDAATDIYNFIKMKECFDNLCKSVLE